MRSCPECGSDMTENWAANNYECPMCKGKADREKQDFRAFRRQVFLALVKRDDTKTCDGTWTDVWVDADRIARAEPKE